MTKKLLVHIKSKLFVIIAIIMVLCVGLVAFGCGNDESQLEYITRIAKEEFGCVKILWYAGGGFQNEVSSVYLYDTYGNKSIVPRESAFEEQRGGSYVVGLDKFGQELFIAIPDKESTERNAKKYSPRLIQWPFAYSFTEIATFAAEHGYKYADGIDGLSDEQLKDYYKGSFGVLNHNNIYHIGNITENFTKFFDDGDKKYDELDVKFVLRYSAEQNEDGRTDYYITQEGGRLVLYEKIRTQLEDYTVIESISEVAIYERKYIEDAVNIARADFACEKILWVDLAEYQNNVIENCIPPKGGYYVVGADKDGNEVYVAVPSYESVKYKATVFEWKFDYTFSQIAQVFGKHGYKYVDGIDGMEYEYCCHKGSTAIGLTDREDHVKKKLAHCGDADELYEKLDVKLIFSFYKWEGDNTRIFRLTQQGGSLVMYETVNDDAQSTVITVYNKDNI